MPTFFDVIFLRRLWCQGEIANQIGLDYSKFTVAVNSTAAIAGADFLGPLMAMPSDQLSALQLGVDAAAPAMVYAPSYSAPRTDDAFARFFALVLYQAAAP
jgi:hypothetical protein